MLTVWGEKEASEEEEAGHDAETQLQNTLRRNFRRRNTRRWGSPCPRNPAVSAPTARLQGRHRPADLHEGSGDLNQPGRSHTRRATAKRDLPLHPEGSAAQQCG